MWYALQTETGKEQDLVNVIKLLINPGIYKDCFYIKRESVSRIKGECVLKKKPLFSGYVFVLTSTPEEFYRQLKSVPFYVKFLGREESEFFSISKQEEEFIESLINGDDEHTVRLSPVVVNGKGDIQKYGGVLKQYSHLIIKKRIRNRYVIIRMELFDRPRDIYMGIRLAGDLGENEREFLKTFSVGNTSPQKPDDNQETTKLEEVTEGSSVVILEGAFEGIAGRVKEIDDKKKTLGIEVEMFGRTQMVWVDWNVKMELL